MSNTELFTLSLIFALFRLYQIQSVCTALNRLACGQIANTCGACVSGGVGKRGPANSKCILPTGNGVQQFAGNFMIELSMPFTIIASKLILVYFLKRFSFELFTYSMYEEVIC